jgi:hypothetical protein
VCVPNLKIFAAATSALANGLGPFSKQPLKTDLASSAFANVCARECGFADYCFCKKHSDTSCKRRESPESILDDFLAQPKLGTFACGTMAQC